MVRKETLALRLENLFDCDAYQDFLHAWEDNKEYDYESREIEKLRQENDEIDEDYKNFLVCLLTKEERFEPHNKRKEIKDNIDHFNSKEENDPQYENFFRNLKEHEKSYVLEYEKDGLALAIKYEIDTTSDQESGLEFRRKLRRATKQENGIPNQIPRVENKRGHNRKTTPIKMNLTRSKSRKVDKSDNVETVKRSTNGVLPDMDYLFFIENAKVVGHQLVYKYGDDTVVYETIDGENYLEKENHDDESPSDVEIIEAGNFDPSEVNKHIAGAPTFREDVIIFLKRPFDRDEYNNLLEAIKTRKPKLSHRELRGGREKSCSTHRDGKSYLDQYPDVLQKLKKYYPEAGKYYPEAGKYLNILRGFFFWLKNSPREGAFKPWNDKECLSVEPKFD